MTQSQSEYPHWKEALLGNGHAANLYCAIKYFIWHAGYAVLAAILLGGWALGKAAEWLADRIGRRNLPNTGLKQKAQSFFESSTVKSLGRVVAVLIVGLAIAANVYTLIVYTYPYLMLIGAIIVLLVGLVIGVPAFGRISGWHLSESGKQTIGKRTIQKSQETPLFRRIIGYCPVDMDLEPKWFDGLLDRVMGDL